MLVVHSPRAHHSIHDSRTRSSTTTVLLSAGIRLNRIRTNTLRCVCKRAHTIINVQRIQPIDVSALNKQSTAVSAGPLRDDIKALGRRDQRHDSNGPSDEQLQNMFHTFKYEWQPKFVCAAHLQPDLVTLQTAQKAHGSSAPRRSGVSRRHLNIQMNIRLSHHHHHRFQLHHTENACAYIGWARISHTMMH